jgi:hypothetical protein
MRRVVAWVDGVSHVSVSWASPFGSILFRGPSRAPFSTEAVDPLMDPVTKMPSQTELTSVVPYLQTPTLSPSSTSTPSNSVSVPPPPTPRPYNYTPQRDSADSPTLYYSSSPSLASRSDEDDEPYLIYSTPIPGTSQPSPPLVPPSPSPSPPVSKPVAPAYTPATPVPHISPPPQAPSSRRIHGRMRSLSSIREEDECGA